MPAADPENRSRNTKGGCANSAASASPIQRESTAMLTFFLGSFLVIFATGVVSLGALSFIK